MSLWDGETNLFLDESDPRGLGLSETAYNFIGEGARSRDERAHRAHGELVQAPQGGTTTARRGRPSGSRTATTTGRRCSSRAGAHRGSHDRRLVQPVPRGCGGPRCGAGRDRVGARRGEPNSENLCDPVRRAARAASRRFRRTCSWRRSSSRRTRFSVPVSGQRGRGLRRLLHPGEARRVEPLPRAGHAVGDPRVPHR